MGGKVGKGFAKFGGAFASTLGSVIPGPLGIAARAGGSGLSALGARYGLSPAVIERIRPMLMQRFPKQMLQTLQPRLSQQEPPNGRGLVSPGFALGKKSSRSHKGRSKKGSKKKSTKKGRSKK